MSSLTIDRILRDRARITPARSRSRRAAAPGRTGSSTSAPTSSPRAWCTASGSRRSPGTRASMSRRCSRARRPARSSIRSPGGSRLPRSRISSTTPTRTCSSSRTSTTSSERLRSRSRRSRRGVHRAGRGSGHGPAGHDPLFLIYTSGTTGKPKGALLTHANCFWTNLSFDLATGIRPDDVVLQVLPQFHCGGWNVQSILAWWKGAKIVLERGFDARRALELIERDGSRRRWASRRPICSCRRSRGLRTPTSPRFASRSSAARRCRRRCSTSGRGAASRSCRGTASPRRPRTCCACRRRTRGARRAGRGSHIRTSSATSRRKGNSSFAGRTSSPATGATSRRPSGVLRRLAPHRRRRRA